MLLNVAQVVLPDFVVERHPVDVEDPGGLADVSAGVLENRHDVSLLDLGERGGSIGSAAGRARDEPEVRRLNDGRLRHDEAALEDVAQLADVPRPVMGHQERHRLGRDPLRLAVHLDSEVLEEVVDEDRNILAPLSEAREAEGVSAEAMALLMAHDWPGNVRELRNVLERGLVVAKTPVIQASDLGLVAGAAGGGTDRPAALSEVEKRHIVSVLQHTGGNVSQAARILDIDRVTLYNKIRKYHLRDVGEQEVVP
jgi:hypothetical protein